MQRTVMFIAGEPSGDQNAAGVCAALRRIAPEIRMFGATGPQMQAAGCERIADLTQMAVIGLVEVARNYLVIRRVFFQLLDAVAHRKPDAVVLTDYGGFNLRFAKALRERGYRGKIIYFISPQVWASRPERAQTLAECCDLLLSLFAFEQDWYALRVPSLRVEWVGHPLVERLAPLELRTMRRENLVALLPGSRATEISRLWQPLVDASAIIRQGERQSQFVAAAASGELARRLKAPNVRVVVGETAKVLQEAEIVIVASGTATLECAFWSCPMLIVYRVAWPTYWIGRALIQVPWLGMPNILAGKRIVPEFIQGDCAPQKIAAAALDLLQHPEKREAQRAALAGIIAKLGPAGASERAAKAILGEL